MGDRFGRRVAATTVALVVVGTATLLAVRSFGPARTSRPRASEQAPGAADAWEGLRAGWTELPPPPEIREGATLVWTGRGLIAWGGTAPRDDSYAPTADGYAFDPTSRTWSAIPAGPVARIDAYSVWTGTEVLIWGGTQKELRVDGAAFDPSTDSWRPIPAAPIEPRYPAAVVWTGRELLVWGGGPDRKETFVDGAAYDPASDAWRRIADSPIKLNLANGVWSGREMLVFGSLLDNRNRAATDTSVGAAYDPADDTWRRLPRSDLSPQATSAGWVGDRMVAWDYQVHAQEYSPGDNIWSAPQKMPLSASECYPDSAVVGRLLFAWFCGDIALYDAATGGWRRVRGGVTKPTVEANGNSYRLYRFAALASAGDVLALEAEGITVNKRGVPCYGCPGSPVSFWVYRPPAAPSSTVEDGSIAFSRGGSESGLYVVNPDGTRVTRLPSERGDNDAAWSPDGSRIAFVRYQAGDSGLYVMNADGTDVLQITNGGSDGSPTWSPDGTHIAFAREASGNADIYVMDADGTHLDRLTDDRRQESSPAWSPDGSRIAFDGWDDASGGQPPSPVRLYVMNEDGTGIRALGPQNVAGAAWSPDGSKIAFADTETGSIMAIHPDGSRERSIVDSAEVVGGVHLVYGPTWSPDGTKIAFFAGPDAAHTRIYVVNRDGSGLTQLTHGPAADAEPAWQPVPIEGGSPSPSPPASVPAPATPVVSNVALPDGLGASRVAIGEGAVWALASTGKAGSSVLVRIDPATDQVLAMTPLEAEPWYMAAGGGAVWVGSPRSSTIERVDSATNEVTGQIQLTGDGVGAIAADDQAVWVEVIQDRSDQGQQNLASLVRIDPQTNEVVATIPLDGFTGYDDEIAIGAGSVWVAGVSYSGNAERGSDLIRIDPATNTIVATIPGPAFSVRAGADAVWVTSPADGVDDSLHKPESWVAREIDPTTNAVSAPISLPGNVSGVLAVTAEGVWFSGYDDQGLIHPVRLQDGTFDASVPPIDSMYTDVAFDEAAGTIWVAAVSGLERIDTR